MSGDEILGGLDTVALGKIRFGISIAMSKEFLSDYQVNISEYMADMVNAQIRMSLWGRDHQKRTLASFPADWWQAFKERWFPRWALKRWPVRRTFVNVTGASVFPTLNYIAPGHTEKLFVIVERKDK